MMNIISSRKGKREVDIDVSKCTTHRYPIRKLSPEIQGEPSNAVEIIPSLSSHFLITHNSNDFMLTPMQYLFNCQR